VKIKRQSAILLVPMIIAWALDVATTLFFQPAGYWAGDYLQVNEATAIFRHLLVRHPLLFVAGNGVYIAVCCFATLIVHPRIGRYIVTANTVGHVWAASNWLWLKSPLDGDFVFWVVQVPISVCLMACLECSFRWQQHEATRLHR
jgi:uncharacterized membrane protein